MIIVNPRLFEVEFLDGSLVYYRSLGGLIKALQSYPLEKLKEIKNMELISLAGVSPSSLPGGW